MPSATLIYKNLVDGEQSREISGASKIDPISPTSTVSVDKYSLSLKLYTAFSCFQLQILTASRNLPNNFLLINLYSYNDIFQEFEFQLSTSCDYTQYEFICETKNTKNTDSRVLKESSSVEGPIVTGCESTWFIFNFCSVFFVNFLVLILLSYCLSLDSAV